MKSKKIVFNNLKINYKNWLDYLEDTLFRNKNDISNISSADWA